ncbi:MAG TPA: TlpA disulfide reductase family protein [Bacteroidales bacterium]|jgi:thiol-disulfide isomerase/thioredoxin|nr:TlpA disulfide reductase family protein [Bacteroidales bacterium]
MKHHHLLFALLAGAILAGCSGKNKTPEIQVVKYEALQSIYTQNDDVLYVVNFWATWCAPCVEELPDFMEVHQEMETNPAYKMLLVSLDEVEQLESSVVKMAMEMELNADLYLLDDITRMNQWIPAIDSSWSGTIPATLFIKNGKKLEFVSKPMTKEELRSKINLYENNH